MPSRGVEQGHRLPDLPGTAVQALPPCTQILPGGLAPEQMLLAAAGNYWLSRSGCRPGWASQPRDRSDLIRAWGQPCLDPGSLTARCLTPLAKILSTGLSPAPGTFPIPHPHPHLVLYSRVMAIRGQEGPPSPEGPIPDLHPCNHKQPPPETPHLKVGGKVRSKTNWEEKTGRKRHQKWKSLSLSSGPSSQDGGVMSPDHCRWSASRPPPPFWPHLPTARDGAGDVPQHA